MTTEQLRQEALFQATMACVGRMRKQACSRMPSMKNAAK